MSTSEQIRDAWEEYVWRNEDILQMTTKIYSEDITQGSQPESARLRHRGRINFITYVATRRRLEESLGGCITYGHRVVVTYFIEKDPKGGKSDEVVDRLIEIDAIVRSQLGQSWQSEVDFYVLSAVEDPALIALDNKEVWRHQYVYEATDREAI